MQWVLASNNAGKCREIQAALKAFDIELISQAEFNVPEIEETGTTFVENAIIKARHAAALSKLPALADDSGLVVEVLAGKPGVLSARFAGASTSPQEYCRPLLEAMAEIPHNKRQAYFYCALVLMQSPDDPVPQIFEGRWQGSILTEVTGSQGFGYDPVFYVPETNCTAAQLSVEQKNAIGHRGKALELLKFSFS